jgi:uncharacterized membrane protein YoaK (UPF0700 family)
MPNLARSQRSLFYPAGYLLGTGACLMFAPRVALKLCFSSGDYGDVMPRMAGVLVFALGILVVQIIRHRAEQLYLTLIGVRVFLCAGWVALYLRSHDVFFLCVFVVVAVGLVWTSVGYYIDRLHEKA